MSNGSAAGALDAVAGPRAVDPCRIAVPERAGRVRLVRRGRDPRVLAVLEDLHSHPPTQRTMAQCIDALRQDLDLRLVLTEGGLGDVSLRAWRNRPYAERLRDAEQRLSTSAISAEEYVSILRHPEDPFEVWGAESGEFYDIAMRRLLRLRSLVAIGGPALRRFRRALLAIGRLVHSPAYLEADALRREYVGGRVGVRVFSQRLVAMASAHRTPLAEYENTVRYRAMVSELEARIDWAEVNEQRSRLLDTLPSRIPWARRDELERSARRFRDGEISAYAFHRPLVDLALPGEAPELAKYVAYLAAYEAIDQTGLFRETDALTLRLLRSLARGPEARPLYEAGWAAGLAEALIDVSLSPVRHDAFLRHPEAFDVERWAYLLRSLSERYGVPCRVPRRGTRELQDAIDAGGELYTWELRREDAIVGNALRRFDESGQAFALLIVGGFHTPGITRRLDQAGLSWVVIQPKVEGKQDRAHYFHMLRSKWRPREWG